MKWKVKRASSSFAFDAINVRRIIKKDNLNVSLDKDVSNNVFNVNELSSKMFGRNNGFDENGVLGVVNYR